MPIRTRMAHIKVIEEAKSPSLLLESEQERFEVSFADKNLLAFRTLVTSNLWCSFNRLIISILIPPDVYLVDPRT